MSTGRKFWKTYGALPLLRASADTLLGELYKQRFLSIRLLPKDENIITRLSLTDAERTALERELRAVRKTSAGFAKIDLTDELEGRTDLNLPMVLPQLQAEVQVKQVTSFVLEDVVEQRFPPNLLRQIEQLVDQVEDQQPEAYKKHLKPYEMAKSLFFARQVVLQRRSDVALSAAAKGAIETIGGTVTLTRNHEERIEYAQPDCPFAAAIVQVKDLGL